MAWTKVDLLVFGAHADDIELTCGGTVITAAMQGQSVGLVDLTRGEMGTRGTAESRAREAKAAQRALKAKFRTTLDLGDGGLATGREEELEIIRLIRMHRPTLILAPWPDDRHPDHSRTGRLVTEASFYAGLTKLKTEAEAHRAQDVIYYLMYYPVLPSLVVDITSAWPQKLKAIAAYKSQFHDPRSKEKGTNIAKESFLDWIEGRARHYGGMIGADFGEPFVSKRPPKVNDLVSAYMGREVS